MVEEYKAAGARAWSDGRYQDAIEQYTLAITNTSNHDKDLLKTLYSNRSAAYMKYVIDQRSYFRNIFLSLIFIFFLLSFYPFH